MLMMRDSGADFDEETLNPESKSQRHQGKRKETAPAS
jgi:hypothetical protein